MGVYMEFSVKTGHPEKQRANCIIVGVFETRKLSDSAERLDIASEQYLSALMRKGDLEGKLGQSVLLHQVPHVSYDRILLMGCGPATEFGEKAFREIIRKSIYTLIQTGSTDAVSFLTELPVNNRDIHWKIRQAIEITQELLYTFDKFKTKKERIKKALRRMTFMVSSKTDLSAALRAIQEGQAIAASVAFAKDLGNLPPNICTPAYLGKEAEKLAAHFQSISAAVLNEKDIASLKMGAFLSVGQGSKNPPCLITLEYQGRKDKQKPIVLIGKGITFDTGGNSLKTPAAMIGMKYDKCGATTVLATLRAAAELELPLNIVGVIPAAENMPGNAASRPEDIVTSMSGLTIEILNTDAEGRLILCDALTYSERFSPATVITVATLTAACIAALSTHASGLFSNFDPLAQDLLQAGRFSQDKCWQLPLWEEYQDALNSNFADVANIGNPPEAGATLAACFLSRFAQKYHWAHLDIAGTASSRTGKERGATGRPVTLLIQYLLDCVSKSS